MRLRKAAAFLCWSALLFVALPLAGQSTGNLRGLVTDPTGAVIPAATILVHSPSGQMLTATSNGLGQYQVNGLAPGTYTVTATAKGFAPSMKQNVKVLSGRAAKLDIQMAIARQVQNVEVQANANQLQLAPESNASAVTIAGSALDALSNDPDELLSQIQALAGPSVGSGGADIYIDGFTGGDMPPKSAIREIRVNSNPFSAENNRLGYGRVDIFTKPGGEKLHGDFSLEYNNSAMNARSRFLNGMSPLTYHTWLMGGDLSGPLGKKASFYFDVQRRNINRANLVNTDTLDPNLNIVPFTQTVLNPRVLTSFSPRVDLQLSHSNTLATRYRYFQITHSNDGVDTQALASQAYNQERHHHDLRFIDTQTFGPNVVNTVSLQLLHFHNLQVPQSTAPTLDVIGAFLGGGNNSGSFDRLETHYQLADDAEVTRGKHLFRFGGRFLVLPRRENTNGNFNGTFTFNSISDYQKTEQGLKNGMTIQQIQAAGYGPSQFSITTGKLVAAITRLDVAEYFNDDWKVTPQLTASLGARVTSESDSATPLNWGPRLGFAWGLGRGAQTKTVVRGGLGIFYQYFDDDQMIVAERQNGVNQITYIVNRPDFYPSIPSQSTLSADSATAPTLYRISPHLQLPMDVDTALSVEQQVTKDVTASVTWLHSRGYNQFLSNDINAPLPGTYNPNDPASGTRPLGAAAGNIYEYESRGDYSQNEMVANARVNAKNAAMFGYYVWNNANSDTAGPDSFPADPWNIRADYGPSQFDIRSRAVIGGSYALPLEIRVSSLILANSGQPFSIEVPQDVYGTGQHNARPAPVTAATPPGDIVNTRYGSFNVAPGSGELPIPPDTETGPSGFMLNLRVNRTFGFGGESGGQHGGTGGAPEAHHWHHHGGLGGRGLSGQSDAHLEGATNKRFALTLSASVLNVLNNSNLGLPVQVIGSPLFGQSISLATGAYAAQVGNPVANRLVNVGMELDF